MRRKEEGRRRGGRGEGRRERKKEGRGGRRRERSCAPQARTNEQEAVGKSNESRI
jgi:hypothetical protein